MSFYLAADCATFCKTKEPLGGLSNMCAGYPIRIGETVIRTSEHLYQALRFTAYPDIQRDLISLASPMRAKIFAKNHIDKTRPDWEDIKILVMEWCLNLKLLNNMESFGSLLLSTEKKQIVEISKKDSFWGAIPIHDGYLQGQNSLGILLSLLKQRVYDGLNIHREPLFDIPDLHFLGENAISLALSGLPV